MIWTTLLWIAVGGGIGSAARAWIGFAMPHDYPWATLLVNVGGSFLLGFIFGYEVQTRTLHPTARDFLAIGFCGGFTTFSTFSLQTMQQLQARDFGPASLNIASTILGTLLAVWLGMKTGLLLRQHSA